MASLTAGAAAPGVPRRLARDTRIRALALWAGVRLGLSAIGPFIGAPSAGVVAFVWVEVLAVLLVQADLGVCRETVLLANLGVSRLQVFMLTLPAVFLPEAIVQVLLLFLIG